jgi:tRNA threonylcarbamoyladenosine biosynthesis protein TsaB
VTRAVAIETSGRIGSVAVIRDDCLLSEQTFPHGLAHAAQVVTILDRQIAAAGWKPDRLDHLYVSIGPGSFTGLRIAVTLAKTLALATGVKLVAVPTARVLVENAPDEAKHVAIVLDAKRGQIFTAGFSRDPRGAWQATSVPHLDTLANVLSASPRPLHMLGEGINYHREALDPSDPTVIVMPQESWTARASGVARVGAAMADRGDFADPFTLTPLYIRLPEAEEKLQQRGG